MNTFKLTKIFLVLFCILFTAHAYSSKARQFHHPSEFVKTLKNTQHAGAKIYKAFCAVCHDEKPMIQLQAPKFRHADDWKERLKQTSETLFKHVDEGFNNMPARGGCFECSNKELQQAIDYMLPEKNK